MFDGRKASVISLEPLEAGREVYISYIDVLLNRSTRRDRLQQTYFFDCECARCVHKEGDDQINRSDSAGVGWREAVRLAEPHMIQTGFESIYHPTLPTAMYQILSSIHNMTEYRRIYSMQSYQNVRRLINVSCLILSIGVSFI